MNACIEIYFNFRSPYCYLASKTMFDVIEQPGVQFKWMPLGGWNGRSSPERAKVKVPLVRQDVRRFCRRMGIAFNAPPVTTDPTAAAAASLYAQEHGVLKPFIQHTMDEEWAHGQDIGQTEVLARIAKQIGLPPDELIQQSQSPVHLETLNANQQQALSKGVIGVPSFVIGDEIFWGQDRLDFVAEHLRTIEQTDRKTGA